MKWILVLFISILTAIQSYAQLPNDCVNAIVVCGNGVFESNASNIGNVQEISNCLGFEHNSIWLKINIAQTGTLGFELIPNNPSILVDYDFWVFGANAVCGALGNPIRCCTTNPNAAGLSSNHTGLIGTTFNTQSGPGANGNGYVRWLDVVAGQSYYICIDRPEGDDGFQLQWTGSATLGTGAFPNPPTANSISEFPTCSSTNSGIFDLNTVRSSINSDLVGNTISFFETLADAIDNVSSLTNIYSNISNPQIIYAKVKNNATGCFTIAEVNLVVNVLPAASFVVSSNSICQGDYVTVTFSGSPNTTIEYSINNGTTQTAVLNGSGNFVITQTPNTNTTYKLITVKLVDAFGNVKCTNSINQSLTVTINPLPTATISGGTTVCVNDTSPAIIFTGSNGTAPYTFTYTINGNIQPTITTTTGNSITINAPTTASGTFSYVLTNVADIHCSQVQNQTTIVEVNSKPTASISGGTTVCINDTSPTIIFTGANGTAPYTFTYRINGIIQPTITTTTGNSISLNAPTTASGTFNYVVTNVADIHCSQSQNQTISVVVSPKPTASISGGTTVCINNTAPTIIFTGSNGTAPYTFTYAINGTIQPTITTTTGNSITLNAPTSTTGTFNYVLTNVADVNCSQTQNQTTIVMVNPLPTASISGGTTVCITNPEPSITFTGSNGTAPYTFSYTINGIAQPTITTNTGNSISINTPTTAEATFNYVLTNVADVHCSQPQNSATTVIVISKPTLTILGNTSICSDSDINITLSSNIASTSFSWTAQATNVIGASNGSGNLISQNLSTIENTSGSVIYTVTSLTNGCNDTTRINVIVRENPNINLEDVYAICEGDDITITAPNGFTTYTWSNGVNMQQNTITMAGDYSLTVTKDYGDVICSSSKDITVYSSSIATITSIITDDFSEDNYIQILVSGDGVYEYSINGNNYQDSNVFNNLLTGVYEIHVRDKKGCGIAKKDITVLNYPKFFTPNQDGFNDYWSINFTEIDKNTKVNIFDRYGKLLYFFKGNNQGWDGKYQSKDLPSTDYWFVIIREDGREYKGHFSLKR